MPTFAGEAMVLTEWYNARGRSRPFSLFFGSALALIWMIQWRCAFCAPSPFKIPFFTAPPTHGDLEICLSERIMVIKLPLWVRGRENHSLVNRLDKENPSLIDPKLGELIHTEWVFYQYECHPLVKVVFDEFFWHFRLETRKLNNVKFLNRMISLGFVFVFEFPLSNTLHICFWWALSRVYPTDWHTC